MPVKLNQKGLSLIEILVAMGLLGVVAIAVGTQMTESAKMGRYLNQSYGYSQLSREIASATKSSLLCSKFDFKFIPPQNFDLAQAATSAGQDVTVSLGGSIAGNNSSLPNFGVAESTLKLSNVTALGLVNTNGEPLYQGLLKLSGKKGSGSNLAPFPQRIVSSVVFSTSSGQISGCYGNNDVPPTPCNVDPATGQCSSVFPPSAVNSCPIGSIATGYQAGILQCQQINETCPSNQVVVAINNGKALCGTLPPPVTTTPLPPANPGTGDAAKHTQYSQVDCTYIAAGMIMPAICSDFDNISALETKMGFPECRAPVLGQKCISRSTFLYDGAYGGTSFVAKLITVFIGTPLY